MTIIVLIGPPGSGKGTQSDFLVKDFGFYKITAGDLLRNEIALNSELGKEIESYIQKGHLVPDALICQIVTEEMKNYFNENIILDGTPRTLVQAKFLDEQLASMGRHIDAVIELRINEALLFERINSRFTCAKCKASFNKKIHNDSTQPCPYCGSKEYFIRSDDNETVLKERIAVYNEEIAVILQYYNDKKKLLTVDGSQEISKVAEDFKNILSAL
jgi:adenylate kinase